MNTFLPFNDFEKSAKSLDYRRLGKQRVETKQILYALLGVSKGWRNHPATMMWDGHIRFLCLYGIAMCDEWIARGYVDNTRPVFIHALQQHTGTKPKWLGNEDFHRSHQSNLIRKMPEHYGPLFPGVPNNLPYIWPTKDLNG